jgi:hypothetical protein
MKKKYESTQVNPQTHDHGNHEILKPGLIKKFNSQLI